MYLHCAYNLEPKLQQVFATPKLGLARTTKMLDLPKKWSHSANLHVHYWN
jgi:hypothetical protein